MNTKRILGLGFLVALSACKGQCSCGTDDDGDTSGVGGGNTGGNDVVSATVSGSTVTGTGGAGGGGEGGAGTGGDPATTGGTGGTGGGGAPPVIVDPTIRFLNVASNAEDANFCILDEDGELSEPLISGGLASPNVSAYAVEFASPGNYSIVLAAADDEACDADAGQVFGPFALGDGGIYTLALVGNALDDANPVELVALEDSLDYPAAGSTKLRFVHAAAGAPPVDIGEYVEDQFVPYFTGVAYGDDGGYTEEVPAFEGATLVARAAGSETDLLSVPGVDGEDGAIVNAIAVGNVLDGVIDVNVFFFSDSPTN